VGDYGIGSWPHRQARIRPAGIALRQGARSLTYAQLAERVDRLAGALAARGVGRGDRVAYLGWNNIAGFEAFFAAGRIGALFVPLNARLVAPEIAYLLDDCEPAALFHGSEHQDLVRQEGVYEGLVLGPADQERMTLHGGPAPAGDVGLEDDAVILYTSGTSGRPKGAVLTHGNLTFNTMNQLAHVDVLSTDHALCIAPLFHATGLGQVSLPTLFKGGTVTVVANFDPGAVLSAIETERITSFSAVPTILQMLCDHPAYGRTDLTSLRYVIYGGSMATERVTRSWQQRGVTLLQGYGMTEAAPGVTLATAEGATGRPMSVGLPHFFTDTALRPIGDDGKGELLVSGPNVFRGYFKRPAATAEAMDGGWFRTGDVVRVDEEGWTYVVDRIKDLIISGGENIYPAEVEACINTLAGVKESAVIGVPDARWGEVGLAYVVTTDDSGPTAEGIREALRDRLAAFKIPAYMKIVDHLPRNATGKIVKARLR
jgi:fatty-acyl-CoA synthase